MAESADVTVTVARLDERMEGMQREMSALAQNMMRLTSAVQELTRAHARISTVEAQVATLLSGQDAIWKDIRRIEGQFHEFKTTSTQRRGDGLFEVVKLIIYCVAGAVVSHIVFKG